MPKAKSLTGSTETVRRWKIYSDGRVEDANGHIHDELPEMIAFSSSCVELVKQGKLEVEGLVLSKEKPAEQPPAPVPAPEPEVDAETGFRKPRRR